MLKNLSHVFDRSGLAAISDLQSEQWEIIFRQLEQSQSQFLAREAEYRSPEYKWPRDPLHTWSRVWEYPYTYHHLRQWRISQGNGQNLHVVDLGSGVTFFPFSIARLGYTVTCVDVDPVVATDLPRAVKALDPKPGSIRCKIYDGSRLPFADGEIDAVYCVSVLEHIPCFEATIAVIARVLKPGGLLVLTIDLDLRGDQAIGPEGYKRLTESLHKRLDYYRPVTTVHPVEVVTSVHSPFASPNRSLPGYIMREAVRRVLGRRPASRVPFQLAVEGMVLIRRNE